MNTRPISYQTMETLLARTVEEGECLLWEGSMGNARVPQATHGGKMVPVRRLMLEFQGKPPTSTDFVSCTCGNHLCVSPSHIQRRTKEEHVVAMGSSPNRKRLARASKLASYAREHRAKLTMEQAREIRCSDESGTVLADRYGVHRCLINRIKRGEAWRGYSNPFAGLY